MRIAVLGGTKFIGGDADLLRVPDAALPAPPGRW